MDLSPSRYAAMTVNERLLAAGLLEAFDIAARRRDRASMIALLVQVDLAPGQSAETTDAILSNPSRYGY